MPHPIQLAQPPLEFIPPQYNPLVRYMMQVILPVVLRFRLRPWLPTGIAQVETVNVEVLAKLYQQFQAGKIRFLIAFRHPEVDDPLCMFHLVSKAVPEIARKKEFRCNLQSILTLFTSGE